MGTVVTTGSHQHFATHPPDYGRHRETHLVRSKGIGQRDEDLGIDLFPRLFHLGIDPESVGDDGQDRAFRRVHGIAGLKGGLEHGFSVKDHDDLFEFGQRFEHEKVFVICVAGRT